MEMKPDHVLAQKSTLSSSQSFLRVFRIFSGDVLYSEFIHVNILFDRQKNTFITYGKAAMVASLTKMSFFVPRAVEIGWGGGSYNEKEKEKKVCQFYTPNAEKWGYAIDSKKEILPCVCCRTHRAGGCSPAEPLEARICCQQLRLVSLSWRSISETELKKHMRNV